MSTLNPNYKLKYFIFFPANLKFEKQNFRELDIARFKPITLHRIIKSQLGQSSKSDA